jgi:hypothetical protein
LKFTGAILEFILPTIGAIICYPIFVIAGIVLFLISAGVIYCTATKDKRQKYYVTAACLCLIPFTTIFPFLFWLVGCSIGDICTAHRQDVANSEAVWFWSWFKTINSELYDAKQENDPSIQKLRLKLQELCPKVHFKLGPIHDGQREIAFTHGDCELTQCKINPRALVEEAERSKIKNFYVGYGFPQGRPQGADSVSLVRTHDYHSKDFQMIARRNKDVIDVAVYTDEPFLNTSNDDFPVDFFLENNLGTEFFKRYLGSVTINKVSKLKKGSKTRPIDQAFDAFLEQLTAEEKHDLSATITSKPCVWRTSKLAPGRTALTSFSLVHEDILNPYLPIHH